MKCPICGTDNSVGKLYEFVRCGKILTQFYCSTCSVEFSAVGLNASVYDGFTRS